MAAFDRERLYQTILDRLGVEEQVRVQGLIGSSTLRESIELLVDASEGTARLFIPHYWAEYYHDGRGSVSPVDARFLVFFTNPADDPRLAAGYPVRAKDLVRLTKEQWDEGLEINAQRRAEGLPPYMIVVRRVGPAAPHPFFDDLAGGAADRADPLIHRHFDDMVQELVDFDRDVAPETKTASFDF